MFRPVIRMPPPEPTSPAAPTGEGVRIPTVTVTTVHAAPTANGAEMFFPDEVSAELAGGMMPQPFVHKRFLGAIGGILSGGGIAGAISGFAGDGGGGRPALGSVGGSGFGFTGRRNIRGGGDDRGCIVPGMKRDAQGNCSFFLGDQPGRDFRGGEAGGEAVVGGFNMPAFVPSVVGNITRRDGSTGPILRCPSGTVLATDNLCYSKGIKGLAAHRKWKPARAPFLPRRDLVCLDRVVALKANKTLKGRLRSLGLG